MIVGAHRIKRIRKELGLHCKQRKKFEATTDSRHNLPVSDNLQSQDFKVTAPCQVWLAVLTYVPTAKGWLYLAGLKDLFTGEIVDYAIDRSMTRDLVCRSLIRAVKAKRPAHGLIL